MAKHRVVLLQRNGHRVALGCKALEKQDSKVAGRTLVLHTVDDQSQRLCICLSSPHMPVCLSVCMSASPTAPDCAYDCICASMHTWLMSTLTAALRSHNMPPKQGNRSLVGQGQVCKPPTWFRLEEERMRSGRSSSSPAVYEPL